MKHWLLKFNYGIEIGARLAYLGHYRVTKNSEVLEIANEELVHRYELGKILEYYGQKPSKVINAAFTVIGYTINILCTFSPNFLLNFVAQSMEVFAIANYWQLAKLYPKHVDTFIEMAETEKRHEEYFAA